MYILMRVYIYMYMYIHIYIYTHMRISVYMYDAFMSICVYVYIYIHVYMCILIETQAVYYVMLGPTSMCQGLQAAWFSRALLLSVIVNRKERRPQGFLRAKSTEQDITFWWAPSGNLT